MQGETKSWVRRFDIAQLFQNKIDFSAWKGDEHTKGVFFDSTHGIVLNKIMAVRIRQEIGDKEKTLQEDLFLSFQSIHDRYEDGEDGSPVLTDQYPFTDMKVRPKKHFLLFDKDKIEKPEIMNIFDFDCKFGQIRVPPQPILHALEQVTNKRDRERSAVSLEVEKGKLHVEVYKSSSRRKKHRLAKDEIECDIISEQTEGDVFGGTVNAHTLMYLLGIFYPFSYVNFLFGRDRIMITGSKDDHTPNVEVVVSRLKTA